MAEDLFEQRQFDLAIAVGEAVVAKQPAVDAKLLRTAWTVIAHSQFDLQNFGIAENSYYSLRNYTPADDVAAGQEIKDRIASAIYKQGEQARDAGNLESAVTHFTRLGQVGFQMCRNLGIRFSRVAHPKLAVHSVSFDEVLFALKDEAWESALFKGLNDFYLQ